MALRTALMGALVGLGLACASAAAQDSVAPAATTGGAAPPQPQIVAPAMPAPPLPAAPIPVEIAPAVPAKPKKKVAPPPPLETALSTDPQPTLQPDTAATTEKAAERYAAIVAAGGWPTDIAPLRPGSRGPAVAELRRRLTIEGDLEAGAGASQGWDANLTAAVKRFQS